METKQPTGLDYLIPLLDELQSQLAFEKQRDLSTSPEWTPEYYGGYIDGLEQAITVIKEHVGQLIPF